jgi:2-deoxy-D-gluconate 3-dehydrogenase
VLLVICDPIKEVSMTSPFSIDGSVALVTGGNSGLGRAMALAFREAGARVAIGGRRADRNGATVAELGPDSAAFQLDVSDEESVERMIKICFCVP